MWVKSYDTSGNLHGRVNLGRSFAIYAAGAGSEWFVNVESGDSIQFRASPILTSQAAALAAIDDLLEI